MSKRILVKESSFFKFLNSFFKAKSDNKEDQWLNTVKNKNPELGKAWEKYNNSIDQSWNTLHRVMVARGLDTTELEKGMKQFGIKVDPKKSSY
jgi:hypothetical protein